MREQLGYGEKFEVYLMSSRFLRNLDAGEELFNEGIDSILARIGKRLFVPYRDIPRTEDEESKSNILEKIIIPSSELIICPSKQTLTHEGPEICEKFGDNRKRYYQALNLEIPAAYLVERADFTEDERYNIIGFDSSAEGLEKIEKFLRDFYRHYI